MEKYITDIVKNLIVFVFCIGTTYAQTPVNLTQKNIPPDPAVGATAEDFDTFAWQGEGS